MYRMCACVNTRGTIGRVSTSLNVKTALADLMEMDAKNGLLTRDITVVDLRLPDRLIVRLTDEAAMRRKAGASAFGTRRRGGADT